MNIVLMGYMGSGKSAIGHYLAKKLNRKHIDLDTYLEVQEKKSVKQIFEEKGEIYFRKKETIYLKELLQTSTDVVLSLGGGTPSFSGNMELINESKNAQSIYLNTSLDILVSRLFTERGKRPLISHIDSEVDLNDFVRKHLFERSFYYTQASLIVKTDNKSITGITEEIIDILF